MLEKQYLGTAKCVFKLLTLEIYALPIALLLSNKTP